MRARVTFRVVTLVLCCVVLNPVFGQELLSVPTPTGSPGSFVTLPFILSGQGNYSYSVSTPTGWLPLTSGGEVTLDERTLLSVTLKLPADALAGSEGVVTLTLTPTAGGGAPVSFRGVIQVAPKVALELLAPPDLTAKLGGAQPFTMVVVNRGNMPDEVTLEGAAAMYEVRFEEARLSLLPGERREVTVNLVPRGTVNSGFKTLVRIVATSGNDADVTARTALEAVFRDSDLAPVRTAGAPPRLTLSVGTGARAQLLVAGDEVSGGLSWSATPGLRGDLSDFTTVEAGVGRLAGSFEDPFAELPSQLNVSLNGGTWHAGTSLAPGSYRVSGGMRVGEWGVSAGAVYRHTSGTPAFGVNAQAVSLSPELDLTLAASSYWQGGGRSDLLAVQYRRQLGAGFDLRLGTSLVGLQDGAGYSLTPIINESLSWQSQYYYATQSYSGNPLAGVHNIGFTGGLRNRGPFSVRASSVLQFSPKEDRWRNSITLASNPLPGLSLQLLAGLDTAPMTTTWRLSPSVGYQFRVGGVSAATGFSYTRTGAFRGPLVTTDRYSARAGFSVSLVSANVSAAYLRGLRGVNLEPVGELSVSAGGAVRLGLGGRFRVDYRYKDDLIGAAYSHETSAAWTQEWSQLLSTNASYTNVSRLTDNGASERREALGFALNARDVLTPGLMVALGYSASSTTGLFAGVEPPTHAFSVRVSHTLKVSFDTPEPVVDFFGGRDGVLVSGVLFRDHDLDGEFGAGDEPIAGAEFKLGGTSVTTGEDGSYQLRVPAGVHGWEFTGALPPFTATFVEPVLDTTLGEPLSVDIPVVPVVPLEVTLFEDADRDGAQGEAERGISFGGVLIDGPSGAREVRTSADGSVTISTLMPGTYTVKPDPARLPPGFTPTGTPLQVTLLEGGKTTRVAVGAAPKEREVVTTFTGGNLAVLPRVSPSRVERGGEVRVEALVSGNPASVVLTFGATELPMELTSGRWVATVTVPDDAAETSYELVVTARRGEQEVSQVVRVTLK